MITELKRRFRKIPFLLRLRCAFSVSKTKRACARFAKRPEISLRLMFQKRLGYPLRLEDPKTFNEKLQWLKLNWRDPAAIVCADKYLVRSYVKQCGLGHILNELYCVADASEEIDWGILPQQFAVKSSHGSGFVLICRDKRAYDWNLESIVMDSWLRFPYHNVDGEWVYRTAPRLIVEKYLENYDGELLDYKFFCFDGEPHYVQVDLNRFSDHKRNIYDHKWNYLPLSIQYPTAPEIQIEKPIHFEEMLEYARVLAKGFPHVRVDLYNVKGAIIFGEMTFFHGGGFEKFSDTRYERLFGDHLRLPRAAREGSIV